MMDRGMSGLHINVPKEENRTRKRHHCRHQPSQARLSSADHDHSLHRTTRATKRAKNTGKRAIAHATRDMAAPPSRCRSRHSDFHAQETDTSCQLATTRETPKLVPRPPEAAPLRHHPCSVARLHHGPPEDS
jgi:hypothetical protein